MRMKKYWLITKNTISEYGVYRLNFIFWRLRVVIRFLITYYLWAALIPLNQSYFGYDRTSMLTYVILVYIIGSFVYATRTGDIGEEIVQGKLTNILLEPLSYFSYIASRDFGDKLLNFLLSLFEIIVLFALLRPPFFIQSNLLLLAFTLLAVVVSICIYFILSALLGLIGFWTTEVWSVRFIFMILIDFLAGNFLPIDAYPVGIRNLLHLTPFPYIIFFPAKIYLGQLSVFEIISGFSVCFFWCICLSLMLKLIWNRGLRSYSAVGR